MPTITIGNPSSRRQVRWHDQVAMPLAEANALPERCLVNGKFVAIKSRVLGVNSQLWDVRCDIPGSSEVTLNDWQPLPASVTIPPFALSPWITDDAAKAVVNIRLVIGGVWKHHFRMAAGTKIRESAVSQTYRFDESWQGWHVSLFATFWTGQDAVDLKGSVIYSDPTSPLWRQESVRLIVETTPLKEGEAIAIYDARRLGARQWWPNQWTIYEGPLPTGVGVTFRGALLPSDDTASGAVPLSFEAQEAALSGAAFVSHRKELLAAAAEAPLCAAARWDQNWLAFGVVPTTPLRADKAAFDAFLAQPGNMFDPLPLANNGEHGSTGSQPPFGATKDVIVLQGDCWRMRELLFSAMDYWKRACHWRELDGRRTTEAIRPGMQTWSGPVEPRMSPDSFGKSRDGAPWGWDRLGGLGIESLGLITDEEIKAGEADIAAGRFIALKDLQAEVGRPYPELTADPRHAPIEFETDGSEDAVAAVRSVYMDDQHRGSAYLHCAYALTGDDLLYECMLDMLAVDEMRAMPARGWYDAPRATGRLWQDWAKALCLVNGDVRDHYLALMRNEIRDRERDQDEWGNDPVMTLQTITDDRVLPGLEAIVPWNNALAVLGALECGAACGRLGLTDTAIHFRQFAIAIGRSLMRYATVRQGTSGPLVPINGLKWLPGGAANPAAYYVYPRAGASTEAQQGIDMLVGDLGWWNWYAGTVVASLDDTDAPDVISQQAALVWSYGAGAQDLLSLEWRALR